MQMTFYLAGEITQVKESIPWVRCASGNVYATFVATCDENHYVDKLDLDVDMIMLEKTRT